MQKLQNTIWWTPLLKTTILFTITYIIYNTISTTTLFLLVITFVCCHLLARTYWHRFRQHGLIEVLPPNVKTVLTEKSIMDIFTDLVYFPYITKIIGAFLRVAIAKPNPQLLNNQFRQFDQHTQQILTKKGLLSLAPTSLQHLVIKAQPTADDLPPIYGQSTWQWDNINRYKHSPTQIHTHTYNKRIFEYINTKLTTTSLLMLIVSSLILLRHANSKQIKKIIIHGGATLLPIFTLFVLVVKMKAKLTLRTRRQALQPVQ